MFPTDFTMQSLSGQLAWPRATDLEIAEVLEEAAEGVLQRGHARFTFGNQDGPQCLLGHLGTAVTKMSPQGEFLHVLAHGAHQAMYHHLNYSPMSWSDEEGRTGEEVRDAFLLTAKDLRNNA